MSTGNDDVDVGARLYQVRERLGLSQQVFASQLGTALRTYQNYERGDRPLSKEVISVLVGRYSIDANWLLCGGEPSRAEPIVMDNFGSLIRLHFQHGGKADVSMGSPEVTRVLRACVAFELRKETPNRNVIRNLLELVEHYYEDGADIELLARTVIAVHAVSLTPEWPGGEDAEGNDADHTDFVDVMKRARSLVEKPPASELGGAREGDTDVQQTIGGEGHQIAGRDVVNNGKAE